VPPLSSGITIPASIADAKDLLLKVKRLRFKYIIWTGSRIGKRLRKACTRTSFVRLTAWNVSVKNVIRRFTMVKYFCDVCGEEMPITSYRKSGCGYLIDITIYDNKDKSRVLVCDTCVFALVNKAYGEQE
jgi:hypothetical protein